MPANNYNTIRAATYAEIYLSILLIENYTFGSDVVKSSDSELTSKKKFSEEDIEIEIFEGI